MRKISLNVHPVGLEEHLPNSVVEIVKHQETVFLRNRKIKKQNNDNKLIEPTESSRIFDKTLKFLTVFGVVLGADFNYEWKCNKRFTITKNIAFFFWFVNISTQVLHVYNHTVIRTLEQFAIYGIGISAVLKLKCFERSFKNITALFCSTQKLCQENKRSRAVKLKDRLQANSTFFKMIAFLAIVIAALFTFYPIKSYIFDKELVPFLPLDFIFLDQSTKFGFHMANFLMVVLGCLAIIITEYMGLTFVMLIMNYAVRVDIVEIDFNELDELWNNVSTSTLALRRMLLRNICQKYIDMRKYITEIKNIFDQKMFVYFVFAYFSQILCLYQIRVNNWIPGYALAIGFFMEMIFYCMMGTQITIDNERLCYIITQSKWYKYDNYSKKIIMFLLNAAMNTKELRIGTLMPLSVLTATEIVKSIYTYYTIMTEIL